MDTGGSRRRRDSGTGRLFAAFLCVAALVVSSAFVVSGATRPTPPSTAAAAGPDPVIAAAGDIACDPLNRSFRDGVGSSRACRQAAVADLLLDPAITAVLPLGDIQYHCGSYDAFMASYDRSWGKVKDITRPVPGNHEYIDEGKQDATATSGCDATNSGAAGYYEYFGAAAGDPAKGYYSYDLGAWHVVALNSNCRPVGGCGDGSTQLRWLRDDLTAHPTACTLAYWHHPRFSSGDHGNDADYSALWDVLHASGVDVVLNSHEHIYERFARQNAAGRADGANGIRQFTVGTGGSNHTEIVAVQPNSEVRETNTFGVLRMTLRPTGYEWSFVPERGGAFTDSGRAGCHAPPT